MTEYGTIRAPQDAVQAARNAKRSDETWGEYLLRCADVEVPRKWTEGEVRGVARDEAMGVIREYQR